MPSNGAQPSRSWTESRVEFPAWVNLESPGLGAPGRRPRHDERWHLCTWIAADTERNESQLRVKSAVSSVSQVSSRPKPDLRHCASNRFPRAQRGPPRVDKGGLIVATASCKATPFSLLAHSTVKCNGQISGAEENLARGLVTEYLSGARVEFVLDPLDIGIGQNREVGTFWEVLPEEAVSVFVEAAFPRVIGLGKIG